MSNVKVGPVSFDCTDDVVCPNCSSVIRPKKFGVCITFEQRVFQLAKLSDCCNGATHAITLATLEEAEELAGQTIVSIEESRGLSGLRLVESDTEEPKTIH